MGIRLLTRFDLLKLLNYKASHHCGHLATNEDERLGCLTEEESASRSVREDDFDARVDEEGDPQCLLCV